MSKNIRAIIFDCDGVLIDSEHAHFLSWHQAMRKYGWDFTLDEYYPYIGRSATENARLLAERMGLKCANALLEEKRTYYYGHLDEVPAIQSTVDFVRLLVQAKEKRGYKLGVASAAKKEEILLNLKRLGIEECFECILSGQDDLQEYTDPEGVNKPKPYIYLHAAKVLGLLPAHCVVIEDSHSGVTAGVRAGCLTIAVPNRFTQGHDLSRAVLKIDSFSNMDVDQFFEFIHFN
ncbi:MAG TPA: HAD family phosphatase [Rhabdochlamydiaceae bacterium]|jgi:beta-phosphoglucomutase-like phosphatase (HAD superfamily)